MSNFINQTGKGGKNAIWIKRQSVIQTMRHAGPFKGKNARILKCLSKFKFFPEFERCPMVIDSFDTPTQQSHWSFVLISTNDSGKHKFQMIELRERKQKSLSLIIQSKWRRYGIRKIKKWLPKVLIGKPQNRSENSHLNTIIQWLLCFAICFCDSVFPFRLYVVSGEQYSFFSIFLVAATISIERHLEINVKQPKTLYFIAISLGCKMVAGSFAHKICAQQYELMNENRLKCVYFRVNVCGKSTE